MLRPHSCVAREESRAGLGRGGGRDMPAGGAEREEAGV